MGFRRKQTIERLSHGQWRDDGTWQPGERQEMTIMASVQPLNDKDYTQIQADGMHTSRSVKIYTSTELYPDRDSSSIAGMGVDHQEADRIIWLGRRWKVVQCDAYQSGVISHYKAIALEENADETGG